MPWADANLTDDSTPHEVESLTVFGKGREPALRAAVQRGRILAESANWARDFGNEPPNTLTPTELAERARAMAEEFGLESRSSAPSACVNWGWARCWPSPAAAPQEPRFIILRYRGVWRMRVGSGLCRQGITFDSGGLSLKPNEGMQTMKMDMCGAAAVLGAMRAIAILKPRSMSRGLCRPARTCR